MEGLNKEKYQVQMVDSTLSEADKKRFKVNNFEHRFQQCCGSGSVLILLLGIRIQEHGNRPKLIYKKTWFTAFQKGTLVVY
jgi:hypothetical protein